MITNMSLRCFERTVHVLDYAKFRPNPPQELISVILEYLGQKCASTLSSNGQKWGVAIDVGCGSGQCTTLLAPHFDRVYGYDVSEAQIAEANKVNLDNNVTYKVSPAESLPLSDGSVELITCSQCFHWLDSERFFKEAKRVLAPNGVVALLGYNKQLVQVKGQPENKAVAEVIQRVYKSPFLAEHYDWAQREMVDSSYAAVVLPFNDVVRRKGIRSYVEANGEEVWGYIRTWSGVEKCLQSSPESAAKVAEGFLKDISSATGIDKLSDIQMEVSFNFFLLMGR